MFLIIENSVSKEINCKCTYDVESLINVKPTIRLGEAE